MVLFAATDGISGTELWRSDGTSAGTVLVKDINPGAADSFPTGFFNWNGSVYFSAIDSLSGRELWKTDGTVAGTMRVKDIEPGPQDSMSGGSIRPGNGELYFCACTYNETGYCGLVNGRYGGGYHYGFRP
jgi:ELWxxDGT repeat protein